MQRWVEQVDSYWFVIYNCQCFFDIVFDVIEQFFQCSLVFFLVGIEDYFVQEVKGFFVVFVIEYVFGVE